MDPIAISVPQMAKLIGVSSKKAYQMVHIEGFPAFKADGRWLVFLEGLREWVRDQAAEGRSL